MKVEKMNSSNTSQSGDGVPATHLPPNEKGSISKTIESMPSMQDFTVAPDKNDEHRDPLSLDSSLSRRAEALHRVRSLRSASRKASPSAERLNASGGGGSIHQEEALPCWAASISSPIEEKDKTNRFGIGKVPHHGAKQKPESADLEESIKKDSNSSDQEAFFVEKHAVAVDSVSFFDPAVAFSEAFSSVVSLPGNCSFPRPVMGRPHYVVSEAPLKPPLASPPGKSPRRAQDLPLPFSTLPQGSFIVNNGLQGSTVEEEKKPLKDGRKGAVEYDKYTSKFDNGCDCENPHGALYKSRSVMFPQQRWQLGPCKKTSYYFSWDGMRKSQWYEEKAPGEDEGYMHDPALTLVLLEPPPFSEEEEDDDETGDLRGDGGYSHLIQTADASYVAYLQYLKHQRQLEKAKIKQEDEKEWQLLHQLKKVVLKMRQACACWTWKQIIWIIFLLALVTVGNFLQIIMLNFWLVSFPPEVKGSNYVVFALPGILFFMFFAVVQIAHLIRFRANMSFAKSVPGMWLLIGVGFMDAINSWMAAYAASFTSEVLQALFMNLSPIYAVFMSKVILRDSRRYMNKWIVLVFFLTLAGVVSVTIYSFIISPSIGHAFWILIFFASIPLRVLMNVWQSLYMIVYTYDSTFNEWLERQYIEEVVENAIRLQLGDSALSKKVMRRRRKKLLTGRKIKSSTRKTGSGAESSFPIASTTSSTFPQNSGTEKQGSQEDGKASTGGLPGSGSPRVVSTSTFTPIASLSHVVESPRPSGDPFSTVFSAHFPVEVHSGTVLPRGDEQKSSSVAFKSDDETPHPGIFRRRPFPPHYSGEGSLTYSKDFRLGQPSPTVMRPSPSWSLGHRNEEEVNGEDLHIPVSLHESLISSKSKLSLSKPDARFHSENGSPSAEMFGSEEQKSKQEYVGRRLDFGSADKQRLVIGDDDLKEVNSNQGNVYEDTGDYEYEEEDDTSLCLTSDYMCGCDEINTNYYQELDPDEVMQVLRSGAGEVIRKGKDREILLEAGEGSGEYRRDLEDFHDVQYFMRRKSRQPFTIPLPQQSRNIGIGTGINLGGPRKSRKYNPEIHSSPYQEHYRSLQDREGDDLSVKVFMLFSDTFWQLCVSLALLPADALPWFGNSPSVNVTWVNFSEGVTYVFTRKMNAIYGILYTLGFVFNYLGAAYLNHYSVALCSMVTQLSSPITALILVIVPSWNKNKDSTPPWYLSLVSIILLSIAALVYVLWEEKTDDEKKEGEMQLKRYKLKL